MQSREAYLISFLRGCADAADRGELGIDLHRVLLNGDLMREAADEFARYTIEQEVPFKSFQDELMYHLVRAELHARMAYNMLYTRGWTKDGSNRRSIWYKTVLSRAQKILEGLYKEEQQRKETADERGRAEVPHQDNQT
jgi:hypothetical protein